MLLNISILLFTPDRVMHANNVKCYSMTDLMIMRMMNLSEAVPVHHFTVTQTQMTASDATSVT